MLTVMEPVAFVDAPERAVRSRWPNLREDWFLERTRAWAESGRGCKRSSSSTAARPPGRPTSG